MKELFDSSSRGLAQGRRISRVIPKETQGRVSPETLAKYCFAGFPLQFSGSQLCEPWKAGRVLLCSAHACQRSQSIFAGDVRCRRGCRPHKLSSRLFKAEECVDGALSPSAVTSDHHASPSDPIQGHAWPLAIGLGSRTVEWLPGSDCVDDSFRSAARRCGQESSSPSESVAAVVRDCLGSDCA